MAGTLKNYYETLGVPRSATDEQIRTAYRKLILKFHPDKNIGDTYFEDLSKKVIEAFQVLTDPSMRAEYDNVYDQTKRTPQKSLIVEDYKEPKFPPSPINTNTEPIQWHGQLYDELIDEQPILNHDLQRIKELLPAYLTAKYHYIKASKNTDAMQEYNIEEQKPAKKKLPGVLICSILITIGLVWICSILLNTKNTHSLSAKNSTNESLLNIIAETVNISCKVIAKRAYFFKNPGNKENTGIFLSQGNEFTALKKYRKYYYIKYQSRLNPNYKISGWINSADVQIIKIN